MKKGSVILAGAGCGSDSITLRAWNALKKADVILYDDLIDENLLLSAKEGCECVYVGKRWHRHSLKQKEIEDLMIRYASEGKQVVRLKGGDSFVFGRGGEEVLALEKVQIPYEVIPGVTSSVAVPEVMGIPVTHRMTARSFTVVTGHTADGTGENYEALAKLDGTLVFLMGLHAAGTIAAELIRFGKDPRTPAAVLSKGFSKEERRWDCTLAELEETAAKASSPAILVVGKTAAMHLEATIPRPLAHVSVAVTGTDHFLRIMSEQLAEAGADEVACPCLAISPRPERIPEDFSEYSWIVFTSANGVRIFFEEMKRRKYDVRRLCGQKFAVIGKGTASELEKYGIQADFMPDRFIGDVFGRELAEKIRENPSPRKEQVLILRAENGSQALTEEFGRAGVRYRDVRIYAAGADTADDPERNRRLTACDYITFSSGAGVRAFFSRWQLPEQAVPVCIGPSTARVFRKYSERACLMPKEYTVRGMVDVICRHHATGSDS